MKKVYYILLTLTMMLCLNLELFAQEEYINKNQKVIINNLGAKINSIGVDYAPTVTPDGELLIFVSQRKGSKTNVSNIASHDFWGMHISGKDFSELGKPYNLDSDSTMYLNSKFNEGVASITADGRTLYFTACNRPNGLGSCDIFQSEWNGKKWSKPFAVVGGINSGFWESQPSISPDGKRLYFVSDRPSELRKGIDIWFSDWNEKIEEWGEANYFKAINTAAMDCSPFIAPDNVTLLFSSNGYQPNLGGLDFYVTRYDPEFRSWSPPAHLAEPLNSYEDEQFMSMPASGDLIYFSSRRDSENGSSGDLDLFVAKVPVMFRAIVLRVNAVDENTGKHVPSAVLIKNTFNDKIITRYTSELDSVIKLVVSQPDFGLTSDSIKFVDYDIESSNIKGKVKKTVRIRNPKYASEDFREFTNILDITLEHNKESSRKEAINWKSSHSILTARSHIVAVEDDKERNLEKITFREVEIKNTIPVLGFVFFDYNSSELPERYSLYNSTKAAIEFDFASLHNKGTIFSYHNLLNVIGKRMHDNLATEITLTGTNSNFQEERKNLALSESRAQTVSDYLVNIWGIDRDRIRIEKRNLPRKPSNTNSDDGKEENQRVEITSSSFDILKPIVTIDTAYHISPEIVRFKEPARVRFGEAFWKLKLTQDKKNIQEYYGEGTSDYDIDWNIAEEMKEPQSDSPIYYEITVNDKEIQKTIVAKDTIPIEIIPLRDKEIYATSKIINEKYSLILFDFGSSEVKDGNKKIVEEINRKVKSNSNIQIIGYTDRSGDDKFNVKLSQKRAVSAAKKVLAGDIIVEGRGESKLLYNNSLPEGRFYCRTVDIIIETPILEHTFNEHK